MTEARDAANAAQRQASDPRVSAFVGASAGSGKTKLLTDRLLRLMLRGASPGRLLCLTFTKAAAAEMATRLNQRLGHWAVAEDATLMEELRGLLGRAPNGEERDRARRLFAEVLELPGGMRIATLHAFAQSVLRGFPLEAGLAPGFSVLEEMDAAAQLAAARDAALPETAEAARLATLTDAKGIAKLLEGLRRDEAKLREALRQGPEALAARLERKLGLMPGACLEALELEAATGMDAQALSRASGGLRTSGNDNDVKRGEALRGILALDAAGRLAGLSAWEDLFLTDKGQVRRQFVTKSAGAQQAMIQAAMTEEGERLRDLRARRQALALKEATMAAIALGLPVLEDFNLAKRRIGRLDYEDLIAAALRLLENPGAAWVLYKLDGGLDHLLLDEAQDSNPAQWGLARALTAEFFAGEGQERAASPRTVFAVGDVKQSIFGFQGADAGGLPREAAYFRNAARMAEMAFREVPLTVSFRSAPPVLALVDAVFADGAARAGVVEEGSMLRHLPDRAGASGRVELWPLLKADAADDPPEWAVPERPGAETGPDARLARALAQRIAHMIGRETLDARHEGDPAIPRPVRAGDILVLVRRRNAFVAQLIRALKELEVPVGGLDRMVLVEQIAVQDVLATLDAILLPDDDLQLAAALKSPIFGLDEEALFALAHDRRGPLHAALMARRGEESVTGRAAEVLAALTARADHLPPSALIAELLSERGARARLLARLGPDAADPLDELLNAAHAHERAHPASLQHFLHWLRGAATEVKREAENAADRVRVMTVHGAKGLQAPIVILPDTTAAPPRAGGWRWTEDGPPALPVPLWAPRQKGFAAQPLADADTARATREQEEENRLLYVALTRAEDRLIVCGWFREKKAEGCWYDKVEQGFLRLDGAREAPFAPADWGGEAAGFLGETMRLAETPQAEPRREDRARDAADEAPPLPAWARTPAPEVEGLRIASPSHMEDETETGSPAPPHAPGDPLGLRFRRGNLIHALLQSLPELPEALREDAARRYLARPGHGLDAATQAEIRGEAMGVLAHPAIAGAFGPGSLAEAPLAGRVGARFIMGIVDRLWVTERRVVVLDYKTNRPPPTRPEDAPPGYLRQLAAYRAVLRQAFPGREVECALVWTYGARVMPIPGGLLDTHAPMA
jgi:ATP-dependent helicase/nuclease subunit A